MPPIGLNVDSQDYTTDLHLKYEDLFSHLSAEGTQIETGLSDMEFASIETTYGFRFPPDLRQFLSIGLPVGADWLDWRHSSAGQVRKRMNAPTEGICLDIRSNAFWYSGWGRMPRFLRRRLAIARQSIRQAPRLIPVYGHRYIPDRPSLPGNPVFSIVQTDIIYYGKNLISYLINEFLGMKVLDKTEVGEYRRIEFWSDLADLGF